jgi:hypothetical protein
LKFYKIVSLEERRGSDYFSVDTETQEPQQDMKVLLCEIIDLEVFKIARQ